MQIECARVLHESLLLRLFLRMVVRLILREKERSKIRDVQMDNFKGLPGIRRMDKVPNACMRVLFPAISGRTHKILLFVIFVFFSKESVNH